MIFRAILIAVALFLIGKVLRGFLGRRVMGGEGTRIDDVLETDPVSGVRVPRKEAIIEVVQGRTVYFASRQTRDEFLRGKPPG